MSLLVLCKVNMHYKRYLVGIEQIPTKVHQGLQFPTFLGWNLLNSYQKWLVVMWFENVVNCIRTANANSLAARG